MKILLRIVVAVVAIGVLGFLFVRSARSTGAEPFAIPRAHLTGWTLALSPANEPLGALLSLTPRPELLPPLSRELFARMGESLHYPVGGMPLVLRSEFDLVRGVIAPEAILDLAKNAGLESAPIQPRCMARRRESSPGVLRGVYFLVFDLPQFTEFRQQLAQRVQSAGGSASLFDPAALSPVVIAAALDGEMAHWMPLRVTEADCFAPITVE
jgi:hypothetical protein